MERSRSSPCLGSVAYIIDTSGAQRRRATAARETDCLRSSAHRYSLAISAQERGVIDEADERRAISLRFARLDPA